MATRDQKADRRRDAVLYAAAFAVPFAAYLLTLGPTAMPEDSAELALAAHVLGVPHPTGYPLYMLLAKAWQVLVPIGSIAYRTNLLSAVAGAATCALIAWVCRLLDCRRSAALLAGLAAGLFRTTWRQSNVAEVYALNALFVAAMFAAFLLWHQRRTERSLVALALIAGLAFTHHHISIFFAAPLLVAAGALHRPLRGALLLKILAAAVLPQALYLYLPLRAAANPPLNWENPTTWPAFWAHVTGGPWVARYGFTRRGGELIGFLTGLAARNLGDLIPAVLLGSAGMAVLARRHTLFWACTLLSFAAVAVSGSMSPVYRMTVGDEFLIPCLLVLALWMGAGAQWIADRLAGAGRWALPALAVALPLFMMAVNWRAIDVSDDWRAYDYAQLVLAEAERDAVIVMHGYTPYMAALYLQAVEGRRPDVDLVAIDFSGTGWFPPTVRSPTIRQALLEAQAIRDTGIAGAPEDWTPLVVRALLSRLEERRPVCCNVDIDPSLLPPGWTVLTVEPLRRVAPAPGLRLVSQSGGPGSLGEHLAPLTVTPRPARIRRGAVLRLVWLWHIGQSVEWPVAVRAFFINHEWLQQSRDPSERPATMGFDATAPLGYAVLPLPATPGGMALRQEMYVVPPRSLAPGRYVILSAFETAGGASRPVAVGEVEIAP